MAKKKKDAPDPDSIIAAHGGVGQWETGVASGVARGSFPRFPGGEGPGEVYLSRAGLPPYDSDVEMLAAWLDAPRTSVGAVNLLGEPGVGKTALAEAVATFRGQDMTTVVCTPDHTKESLFLRFVGEGRGEGGSPFALGPFPHAAKNGDLLYVDEAMLLNDETQPALYALCDGRPYLPEGNVDGTALKIHPDFRVLLSSNPDVRGASMPEPLASRTAGTTVVLKTDANFLRDLGIEETLVAAWEALETAELWRPQVRELLAANYWMPLNPAQAVAAMVGEHCPSSSRLEVTTIVANLLTSGEVQPDGRLVIS